MIHRSCRQIGRRAALSIEISIDGCCLRFSTFVAQSAQQIGYPTTEPISRSLFAFCAHQQRVPSWAGVAAQHRPIQTIRTDHMLTELPTLQNDADGLGPNPGDSRHVIIVGGGAAGFCSPAICCVGSPTHQGDLDRTESDGRPRSRLWHRQSGTSLVRACHKYERLCRRPRSFLGMAACQQAGS
jgi:hypothetical protein